MPEQSYIRDLVAAGTQTDVWGEKYCAYNRTRERFLCGEVAAGDFAAAKLEEQLRALIPGSGAALWIVPFRGISPTSVRAPIDLIYIDRNCVVLDAVGAGPSDFHSPLNWLDHSSILEPWQKETLHRMRFAS